MRGVLGQIRDVRLVDVNGDVINNTPTPAGNVSYDVYIPEYNKGKPIYVCNSEPGTLTSEIGWQIYKMEYVNKGKDLVKKRYADGDASFTKIADDYQTYSYTDI